MTETIIFVGIFCVVIGIYAILKSNKHLQKGAQKQ
jgi:hypothetical protein